MKISVIHSTLYRYQQPVILEAHIFRLRPRVNGGQRLLAFDLQITPTPAGSTECLDQDGTAALNAWFDAPTNELLVRSSFTVELLRDNPFDYVIAGESLKLPMEYPQPLGAALAPYTNRTPVAESVRQYAQMAASAAQFDTLSYLTSLTRQLHKTCRQIIRPDGSPWPSEQTLRAQEGSCRDLAVLFCDLCRTMGLAARFVSGYECSSAGSADPYMHAWAEVYLPGIGWRGYDPSRGLVVSNGHVAVAAGFHYDLASPVAGWYSGGSTSQMETTLDLKIDDTRDKTMAADKRR